MNNLIRKTAIAATVLLFVAISSVAQSYQDVVYLKNGSVIRGLIMEQVPSQSLKLVTPDGSTFSAHLMKWRKYPRKYLR